MKYHIFLFSFFSLLLSTAVYATQPSISNKQAHNVIAEFLRSQTLYWSPVEFPIQIERKSTSRLAKQLDTLFKAQKLNRVKGSKWVDATNLSEKRERLSLYWDYNLDTGSHKSGFVYGRANLKRIIELSDVKNYSNDFYVHAHVSWYVDSMPDWVKRPEFHSIRLIRRSKESFSHPFEKSLYLHYENKKWVVWQPKTS